MSQKKILLILALQVFAFIWLFVGGIWYGSTSLGTNTTTPVPSPSVIPTTPISTFPPITTSPTPNISPTPELNQYPQIEYDFLAISTTEPPIIIFSEIVERTNYFASYVYYFNGEKWSHASINQRQFRIQEVQSLNQYVHSIHAVFSIEGTEFNIDIPQIYTPMVMKSLTIFTKFGGIANESESTIAINNIPVLFKTGLLKGFSYKTSPLDIYDLGITTDWFMFWDKEGNFYQLDKTNTKKYDPNYQSHEFFASIRPNINFSLGNVLYAKSVNVQRNESTILVTTDGGMSLSLTKSYLLKRPYWQDITSGYILTDNNGGYGMYLSFTPKN